MKKVFRNIAVAFAVASCVSSAAATPVSVSAKLDSVQLLMGNMTTLRLEVVQNAGVKGGFPMFAEPSPSGIVAVCGDSVELRTSFTRDTVDIGSGRIQINYKVPVQAFDSGAFQLPQFVYVAGADTARSNHVNLKVIPMNVTADDPIAGFAPVAEPEDKSILDSLPDWMVDYWWLMLAAAALAGVLLWLWKKYRKQGYIIPKKPEPDPYTVAMKRLRELKEKGLWEKGMEKEYFTDLTDILRVYLDRRFGINAMEMTSRQIMDTLSSNRDVKDKRDYVRQILSVADFVKFAKVRPLPADNIAAYDNAVRFVEETRPVEEKESGDASDSESASAGKGGEV